METVYQAEYAGRPVRFAFQYPKTKLYFRSWLHPVDGEDYDARATAEEIARAHELIPEGNAEDYAEYKALIGVTSRVLLRQGCCIFHAVAFLWRGKAWLLTAPSGTGKTTQFLNWRRAFPSEIQMICGDMPVLEQLADGSIRVHPTNWSGKESLGSRTAAPLGGIILLEQGSENRIARMTAHDAVIPILGQFCIDPETEEDIRTLFALLDRMLSGYPVWKLVNLGDEASTRLLKETLAPMTGGYNGTV